MKIHWCVGSSCAELLDMVKGTRSRRAANAMALEKLQQPRVCDEDVLSVLDAWSFYIPEGSTAVESDTLGLVRTRTGQVLATRMNKKYTAVVELLCRWQREHQPPVFTKPFCCTSISANHGYAARLHRDSFNVGPP